MSNHLVATQQVEIKDDIRWFYSRKNFVYTFFTSWYVHRHSVTILLQVHQTFNALPTYVQCFHRDVFFVIVYLETLVRFVCFHTTSCWKQQCLFKIYTQMWMKVWQVVFIACVCWWDIISVKCIFDSSYYV